MVISLSCDRAVWDAVLNNEVVRELRESVNADAAENNSLTSSDEVSDGSKAATSILKMIFDNTKAKAMELIEKITKLVNQLFHPPSEKTTEAATDPFEEKLRSSFLLTVVVLLIVAVARSHRG
ncbi:hypothetical protein L1049_027281 [Liquidambar formosana]|uniref:Uncharacterized protein n=1 Tax=Liquidambar formosana TaxID=63359 RepID=A0AAP0N5S5_LIQFO